MLRWVVSGSRDPPGRRGVPSHSQLPGGLDIFDLVQDPRSIKRRAWSLAAGAWITSVLLAALALASQVAAVRSSSQRLLDEMRRGLAGYRMVLLTPTAPKSPAPAANPPTARARPRIPPPLAVPDPRLLESLDGRVQGFVKDNPVLESIVTRELVRDVDSGALDLNKLLQKSSLEIVFDLDSAGEVRRPRIRKSSGVPSIDHLGLETARVLEKYQLLTSFRGARRMTISIRVGDQITVRLGGETQNGEELEEIRKRVQGTLALLRFALAKSSAAFTLQDIAVETKDTGITLTKVFDKQALVDYLTKYYQEETVK